MRYIAAFLVLFLIACGPQPEYAETAEIYDQGWSHNETVTFSPTIADTTGIYELQLIIDHNTSYRYENIYLNIITSIPGQEDREEQLSIDLATHTGQWIGNCSGDNCKCKVYLLDNFKFPTEGEYHFKISQYTRDPMLTGINGLELQLYRKEVE